MNSGSLYFISHVSERVNLEPFQLQGDISHCIEQAAKRKIEALCTKDGFIRPGSVVVVTRSVGFQQGIHFNGEMTFDVELIADVCRPVRGDQIVCCVHNLNKMGLLAKAGDNNEVHAYVAVDYDHNAEFFSDPRLQEFAMILIEVVGCKIKLNDDKVMIVGKLIKILENEELLGQTMKSKQLPNCEITAKSELDKANTPCDAKAYLGFQNSVKFAKESLIGLSPEAKAGLTCICRNDSAQMINSKRDNMTERCILASSITEDFELIFPNPLYEAQPSAEVYQATSRDFFSLWEIICDFDILPSKSSSDKLTIAHLTDGSSAHVECMLKWREQPYSNSNVQDFADTFLVLSSDVSGEGLADLVEKYPNVQIRSSANQKSDTGSMYSAEHLKKFSTEVMAAGAAHVVTSNLSLHDVDPLFWDYSEQAFHLVLIYQIVGVVTCQRKGGHAIIKIHDVFDKVTAKLVAFLGYWYTEVYITKPFASRSGNPEKFLVAKMFKGMSPKQQIDTYSLLQNWKTIETFFGGEYLHNQQFVVDLPFVKLTQTFIEALHTFNTHIVGQKQLRLLLKTLEQLKMRGLKPSEDRKREQSTFAVNWYRTYMPGRV